MIMPPGCRFIVAPHFHMPLDAPRRLLLGPAVREIESRRQPITAWRSPNADELAMLQPAEDAATSPEGHGTVALFHLPAHLRSAWWRLLEQSVGCIAEGRIAGFDTFATQVVEFLAFKEMAVPSGAHCSVVVRDPGRQPIQDRAAAAMGPDAPPWSSLWGRINLGDEEAGVVLFNGCPDCSTVRLTLGPGEGFRLPREDVLVDGYIADNYEPEVLLVISQDKSSSPPPIVPNG